MVVRLVLSLLLIAPPLAGQTQQATGTVPDGGGGGRMESIFVPPVAGAPFALVLHTEWSRPLSSGGSYTLVNQRRIARDGNGRLYEERWQLVPKGGDQVSTKDVIQIADPNKHTLYNCFTGPKLCELHAYSGSAQETYKPFLYPTGPLPNGKGFHQHEDLGVATTAGVDTTGYRETTTINPGVAGNDRPMITTREFWYSPQLQFNVMSIVDTPQTGKQVFTVTDLVTSEPDPSLFELPAGFKVADRREGADKP